MEPPRLAPPSSPPDPAPSFGFVASVLREEAEAGAADSAPLRLLFEQWTALPLEANRLLGDLSGVQHVTPRILAMYVHSVLLNEKLYCTFRERPVFYAKIIENHGPWVEPLIVAMTAPDSPEETIDLIFRTFCVVIEATPPQPKQEACEFLTVLSIACASSITKQEDGPGSIELLTLLELVLNKLPPSVHATIGHMETFWPNAWRLYGSASDEHLRVLLLFVQRVVITCESLTAELLRMVLVDHRARVLAALGSSQGTAVISALVLLDTLAQCRHEVICDALIGAGFADFIAVNLVIARPNSSILHQFVFRIMKLVIDCASDDSVTKMLGGNLPAWLRTSLAGVSEGCSAHAHLEALAVFLSTGEEASRIKRQRVLQDAPGWDSFATPLVDRASENQADPELLREMSAKKRPQAQVQGPVSCCVCNESLTAYYLIEDKTYCSEHRPAQCASCRSPLTGDMVQVGFLKYCMAHAPPKCVRCEKYINRYLTIPDEGIVCVDCGAPKCVACSQPILQGQCITFRANKYHGGCFRCSLCSSQLGEQFLMAGEALVCLECGKKSEEENANEDEEKTEETN